MKINQVLVESAGATAAFAFGRFNPAHQGHIEVWRTVEQSGKNWFIGTNPTTLGVDDPLPFEVKTAWMTEIYPPVAGHIVPKTSVLELAAYIFKKLRNNENATVAYITDAEDWAWSGKLLNQYNGVEGGHGYYKFAEIIHVPSPRVTSASELRKAARANNKVAFYQASGTDPKVKVNGKTYFDTVRELLLPYMAAEEEKARAAEQRAQAKAEKERLRAEKAAAKANKIKPTKEGVTEGSEQQWTVTVGSKTGGTSHTMTFTGTKEQAIKKAVARFGTSNNPVVKAVPAKQGVAEGAPIVVAQAPIDIRNPKKAPQPYRNKGDIVPDTKPPSTEKRGVKGRPGQRPMPKQDVAEVSTELRNRYVARASDDYGFANFAARASKDHPGLDDYSQEQEQRAKKRAAGLNRALSDKRTGREQNVAEEQKTVAKTWDQMTSQEKLSGVRGRTVWNERTQRYYTVFDVPVKQATDEGWFKNTAAGLALGAAAMGGAQAGTTVDDPSWHSGKYPSHVKSDHTIQKQAGSSSTHQKRISDVTGPNAAGEYKVTVTQNGKIASQFVTKTPPPDWMMKEQDLDEASLATMRDYFAGDKDARDPLEITKQRLYFSKDTDTKPTSRKEFRSQWEYDQWLKQNKLKQISGVKEDEEAGEVEKQKQLIPFPAGTTKVAVSDVYDWYKLGQVISDLDDADPADFGQGAPETVIAFGSEEEEHKLLPLLQRLGLKLKDIDQPVSEACSADSVYKMLSRKNNKRIDQ